MSNFSFLIHSQPVFHNDFSAHTFQSDIWGAPTFEIQGNSRKLKLIPLVRGHQLLKFKEIETQHFSNSCTSIKRGGNKYWTKSNKYWTNPNKYSKNSNKFFSRNVKLDISQKFNLAVNRSTWKRERNKYSSDLTA